MIRTLKSVGLALLLFTATNAAHALDPQRALTQYVVESWGTTEGLPVPGITALAQTREGYLWAGTQEGLARFDGVQFTIFDRGNTPALKSAYVRALLASRDGSIWVGTMGGGLHRLSNGVWTHRDESGGLPDDRVLALSEAPDGSIWGGTLAGGVFRIDGSGIRTYRRKDGLAADFVSVIHAAYDGTVWAGGPAGLSRIRGGAIELFPFAGSAGPLRITSVMQGRDGSVWAGTAGSGLYRLNGKVFEPVRGPGSISSAHILSLLEDSRGSVWFGTMTEGLWRLDRGRFESLGAAGGLAGEVVTTILEDREGTLWAGTNEGLTQLKDGTITTHGEREGLPDGSIRAIYEAQDGTIWMATRGGLIGMRDGALVKIGAADGLATDNILSLWGTRDGSLWIGTLDEGLVRMKDGLFSSYTAKDGLGSNMVLAIVDDRDGRLWIGTSSGLSRFEDGRITTFHRGDGLGGEAISALRHDRRGNLWIGTTDGGLSRFRDGRFTQESSPALKQAIVLSIHEDEEGVLWIGTLGQGLIRKSEEHVRTIDRHDGLYSDSVLHVTEDDYGFLWMNSTKGIFRVSRSDITEFLRGKTTKITPVAYGKSDGMRSVDGNGGTQPAGWKARDGRLWFPTARGAVVVNPAHLRTGGMAPTVLIEQVLVDGKAASPESRTFPAGSSTLEIVYTGITLVAPDKVTFRYKLEGFDSDWREAGTRRAAYYTNLPPGEYQFRVLAVNSDGVVSASPALRTIHIESHFYQRWWFYAALVVLLTMAALFTHRQRILAERRRASARAELDRSMVRGQKMESLGQMASGIAHDFNNALMTALPWTDLLQRKYPRDENVQKASAQIRKAIYRARDVTRQLLDFAQPKKPELRSVDLRQFVDEQLDLIRPAIRPEIGIQVRSNAQVSAMVDPGQLSQVLLNLALNARDAMPGSGELTFTIRMAEARELAERGLAAERFGAISVSDNGTGMSSKTAEQIFDPFFTTKGVGEGTGLGLAVVHRILEQNGGAIYVESELRRGTTFHLLLPLATEAVESTAADVRQPSSEGRLPGLAVLLIDDDTGVSEGLTACLEAEGASVRSATSGPVAIHLLDSGYVPNCVILDLGLPEMPGETVHAEIRRRSSDLPVIISSGYGTGPRIAALLEDPATGYIQKPYEIEDLIKIIQTLAAVKSGIQVS